MGSTEQKSEQSFRFDSHGAGQAKQEDGDGVDGATTDAVTQIAVAVAGDGPAYAQGSTYQTFAHSAGVLFANAVATQQRQNTLSMTHAARGLVPMTAPPRGAELAFVEGIRTEAETRDDLAALIALIRQYQSRP